MYLLTDNMLKTKQKICPAAMLVFVLFRLGRYGLCRNCVTFERFFLPCSVKMGTCESETYKTNMVTLNYVG